ncbi:vomeronasal type-1 receptor 4-like [Notamacropus eugenii]|uniref:vomeronasal type-1 receptor 4-like n=1 Tax=Notamacropus eugenii TaxID=9315 RepID=UPI003B6775CE
MPLHDHVLRITSFCQIAVGVLGNFLQLFFHNLIKSTSHKQRPIDTILAQLAMTNAIMLLSKGIPEAILYFRTAYFLGNYGCKFVFYIRRVSRGISMCTMCLLSAFQAVIISPNNSSLTTLKAKTPKHVRLMCVLCWILTLLMDIYVPMYITGPKNNRSYIRGVNLLYCYWENVFVETAILTTLRDISFVGCMSLASGYMVFLLCRHHQRTQKIHNRRLSPRTSPEIKATQTILLLVGTFVSTYCVSCGLLLYDVYSANSSMWVANVSTFITLCFPTISPFLLISQ